VPGTRNTCVDRLDAGKLGFLFQNFDQKRRERGRSSCFHVFTNFLKSMYDGRGDSNAEERRGEEKTTMKVLLVCLFACLLACFRVSFAAVTVSTFLLSFSSLGHSPRAPCRWIK
jgi:hypothetical protein